MASNAQSKSTPAHGADELFPIRTVSTLTGVNAITLRAWERRYGLINPQRTASGHRLYRREDIDLIQRTLGLLNKGVAIGQVKRSLPASTTRAKSVRGDVWSRYQARMVSAICRFDEPSLEEIYGEALSLYAVQQVTESLLIPLLRELGRRWQSAEGSVAEEHFFSVYLRNKLGARFHHRLRHATGTRLLCACLPGEGHEIGLLLFALQASEAGMTPVLLGADMPLSGIAAALGQARCAAVVLAGSTQPDAAVLTQQLPGLVADSTIPVFVGGTVSVVARDAIIAAGATALGDHVQLGVTRLQAALAGKPTPSYGLAK